MLVVVSDGRRRVVCSRSWDKLLSTSSNVHRTTAPTDFTQKQTYIVSFPVLSMCTYLFRYHYSPFRYLFGPFQYLFSVFSVIFCLFGPFQSFSVFIATELRKNNEITVAVSSFEFMDEWLLMPTRHRIRVSSFQFSWSTSFADRWPTVRGPTLVHGWPLW